MLRPRIESFITQEKFAVRYRDISDKIQLIRSACKQVTRPLTPLQRTYCSVSCVAGFSGHRCAAVPLHAL